MSGISLYSLVLQTFGPQFGSLWCLQNKYWNSGFAKNDLPTNEHPGLVINTNTESQISQIAPGTSKNHIASSGVFTCHLSNSSVKSFFLLFLSVPCQNNDFYNFTHGWNGQTLLNDNDLTRLSNQLLFWRGGNL